MQRRDVLHGALWFAGSSTVSGCLPLARALPSAPGVLGIMLERDVGVIWPGSEYAANDLWRLPTGQWLEAQVYAGFVRGRTGYGLFSVLDAANHCLLCEALRVYGGCIGYEKCLRPGAANQWRYLLYATV